MLADWPVGSTNTDIWPNSITNSWRKERERDRMAGNKDEGGDREPMERIPMVEDSIVEYRP